MITKTPAFLEAFFDEIEKLAALSAADVPPGTSITNSLDELKSNIRPGDIILTKPSASSENWLHKGIQGFQRLRGRKFPKWIHSGVMADPNTITHASLSLKDIKSGVVSGVAKVRNHSLSGLESMGRDFLVVRPKVEDHVRAEAVARAQSTLNVPFNKKDLILAGVMPATRKPGETDMKPASMICSAAVAYAYPGVKFHPTKSFKHTMPADILSSGKVDVVGAYTGDKG